MNQQLFLAAWNLPHLGALQETVREANLLQTMIIPDGRLINLIHWLRPDGKIACVPNLTAMHSVDGAPPWARSEVKAVCNCPNCRRTKEWMEAGR
jgi:hypothetical protein